MGCGASVDTSKLFATPIQVEFPSTNIALLDKNFVILRDLLNEAEMIRASLVNGKQNMFKISNVNLLDEKTSKFPLNLTTAFRMWTNGVSCCNKGSSAENGVWYKIDRENFTYNLGICGELRFFWFAEMLNTYIWGIEKAQNKIPIIIEQMEKAEEKLLFQKDYLKQLTKDLSSAEKQKKAQKYLFRDKTSQILTSSIENIKQSSAIIKSFSENVSIFSQELDELIEQQQVIMSETDVIGYQIYNAYGLLPVHKLKPSDPDKYRMKTKMSNIIYYYPGLKNPPDELEENIREDRIIEQQIRNYSGTKISFNFLNQLRWCGCQAIDLLTTKMSLGLEELNEQKNSLRKLSLLIKESLEIHVLKDDSMTEAWRIFCWILVAEVGEISFLKISDKPPYIVDIKRLQAKIKKEEINELLELFQAYFALIVPSRVNSLNDEWEYFQGCDSELQSLIEGKFLHGEEFMRVDGEKQLPMLNKLAKNIYNMLFYKQVSPQIYEKRYKKYALEGEKLWNTAQQIINDECKNEIAKGVAIKDVASTLSVGEKREDQDLQKRKNKSALFNNTLITTLKYQKIAPK